MIGTEQETRRFMQEKLLRFADKLSIGMSLPIAKFIEDMLFADTLVREKRAKTFI